jgi:hypothetical protein
MLAETNVPHVFNAKGVYDYANPDPLDPFLFTVFLRKSAVVVEYKIRAEKSKGGHYYKRLYTWVYNVKTNKYNEKYLQVLHKTKTGVLLSETPNDLKHSDTFLYSNESPIPKSIYSKSEVKSSSLCPEMVTLIEAHLSKLFGFEIKQGKVPELDDPEAGVYTPEYLYYPFYRVPGNGDFVKKLLDTNPLSSRPSSSSLRYSGYRGLNKALRNSKTKEELISNLVYKSYLKTSEDYEKIMGALELVQMFSHIDLKTSAVEAISQGLVDIFEYENEFMTQPEFLSFKFMLAYLPKEKVSEVLRLVKQLAVFRRENETIADLQRDIYQLNVFSFGHSCSGHSFQTAKQLQQIARKDRQKFAVALWDEFQKSYLESEQNFTPRQEQMKEDDGRKPENNFVKVADALVRAKTRISMYSSPSNQIEKCIKASLSLFGEDISSCPEVIFGKARAEDLNIAVEYVELKRLGYSKNNNLITRLNHNDVTRSLLSEVSIYSDLSHIFVNHLQMGNSTYLTAHTLESILNEASLIIDAELVKIGRAATPQNRMIYLQTTASERKLKGNWKYYDLGVLPSEVESYKTAGIKTKQDIMFWLETKRSLPPEMYEELLNDMAFGASGLNNSSLVPAF